MDRCRIGFQRFQAVLTALIRLEHRARAQEIFVGIDDCALDIRVVPWDGNGGRNRLENGSTLKYKKTRLSLH